jgi:hypothetical protein
MAVAPEQRFEEIYAAATVVVGSTKTALLLGC